MVVSLRKTLNGRLTFKWSLFMRCGSFFIEFSRDLAKHYWSKGCDYFIAFFGLSSLLIVELRIVIYKRKMSEKGKRQVLSLFDINRCLEEFKTKDHQGNSNTDLTLVARDLLNLRKVPLKVTI